MLRLVLIRSQIVSRLCLFAIPLVLPAIALGAGEAALVASGAAMRLLQEGNLRYVAGKSIHPNTNPARREATVKDGQHPIASILSCSDSRVPVETVFDQGIGDIFVIRVAGNVCNVDEAGSIEYGAEHLGTPLLIVLGHTQCGAVTAVATNAELHGNIVPLVAGIRPAVAKAQKEHPDLHGNDLVPAAIEANVWQAIDDLFKNSPIVRTRVKEGKLKVIGAEYDLETGKIRWLGEHPQINRLMNYASPAAAGAH
jgi:carbonic anhydrase